MRNLLYASLVFGLLSTGCAGLKNKTTTAVATDFTPIFLQPVTFEHTFRANIAAKDISFSGILVLKKIALNHYRLVLLNEFGARMLDGTLYEEQWTLHGAIPPFHTKKLREQIFTDLKHLLRENVTSSKVTLYANEENGMQRYRRIFEQRRITVDYDFNASMDLTKMTFSQNGKEQTSYSFEQHADTFPNVRIKRLDGTLEIYLHLLTSPTHTHD